MIKSELRATVSSGLTRPPTSTGIFPNVIRSKSSLAVLGGSQLRAIEPAAIAKIIQGKDRFIRLRSFVVAKIRRDENQIAPADRRRQSRTPRKAQRNSGYARPAKLSRNRLVETLPDKTFRRDNGVDDSCKSKRRGSRSVPDQSM